MTFEEKIDQARALIAIVMQRAKKPAIMCSFGKDSMVVLHLVRAAGHRLPVIFHREPFLPRKYAFANKVIRTYNLTVYDAIPPLGTKVQEKAGAVEIVNYYPGGAAPVVLPTGICAPAEGERSLCALEDFYLKPTGTFNYPWDIVFHGHKSTDKDPIYGDVPLNADVGFNVASVSAAFIIRHFTDDDVWRYLEAFDVPIHLERYEKVDGAWRERADKKFNPDYFPACTACMMPGGGPVPCHRLGGVTVSNVSQQLRWAEREKLAYMPTKES